jgi:galactoside O-acetyltransferase
VSANGFHSRDELAELGLRAYGDDVLIDRTVRIYRPGQLELGSRVRIDAYSVLSCGDGGIWIGSNVHLGAFCFLTGAGRIELHDFCGLSGRSSVYSSNDDYSGAALTGPTVPEHLRNVANAPVTVRRHAIVGAGSVLLPGVTIGEGAAVGALSLVRRDVPDFTIVGGTGRVLGERKRDLLELEHLI